VVNVVARVPEPWWKHTSENGVEGIFTILNAIYLRLLWRFNKMDMVMMNTQVRQHSIFQYSSYWASFDVKLDVKLSMQITGAEYYSPSYSFV
jgi:hypothetical protein